MDEEHTPAERDAAIASGPKQRPEQQQEQQEQPHTPAAAKEIGGPGGLEPTRYGDWERNGRCFDF